MSVDRNWQAFFQQKRSRYIEFWVSYATLHARDHPSLEAELANLFAAAKEARETGHHASVLSLAQSLCTGEGAFLDLRGFMSDSARLLAYAVDGARALGDAVEEGRLLGSLGLCWWALEKYGNAIDCYEHAIAASKRAGDRQSIGRHLGSLGLVWAALMDSRLAIRCLEEALTIARAAEDRQAEASHLGSLGLIWADEGLARTQNGKENAGPYFQNAIRHYERALAIDHEIGDRRGEASHLGNLGNAWRFAGDNAKAIQTIRQALDILDEVKDRRNQGFHLANLGGIYQSLGKIDEARQCWRTALAVYDVYGDPRAVTVRTWLNKLEDLAGSQRVEE